MTRSVLVLNGPNLNLLGERDPQQYGTTSLAEVDALCRETGSALGLEVETFQTNHEGGLVDKVHEVRRTAAAVVVNAGACTHTSVALMDALAVLSQPVVEVHLSNVHAREDFRRTSYVSLVADAVVAGAGTHGYALALRHVAALLDEETRR